MGVKDLWPILAPVQTHKSLADLRGQTLAVDLSIWVCEVQGMKQMQGVVVKPHLRNLFFRVSHLTHLGVKLVFVIDGDPPEVKWGTMVQRQAVRGGRGGGWRGRGGRGGGGTVRKQGRSHFKAVLKECCEMLDYLGIPYVHSCGEAEAMCALLNKEGIVDACITNDGDAFLYGANTVYRNFTMDRKDSHVECYNMADVTRHLDLDREKLIGLGLLLGCDYCPKGVPGVGKEIAIRFMNTVGQESVLDRFQEWKSNRTTYSSQQSLKKVPHCNVCSHPGSAKAHEKAGCKFCHSTEFCEPKDYDYVCPCDWHQLQSQRTQDSAQIAVRQKALTVQGFPDMKVVEEFLKVKDTVCNVHLQWRRPQMFHFQHFTTSKLEWPEVYGLEKILPLVTLFDLRNLQDKGRANVKQYLKPHSIVKTRVRQGVSCLEVEWDKLEGDSLWQGEYYVTIEERELFQAAFPILVGNFEQAKAASKKPVKKSRRTKPQADGSDPQDVEVPSSEGCEETDLAVATKALSSLTIGTAAGRKASHFNEEQGVKTKMHPSECRRDHTPNARTVDCVCIVTDGTNGDLSRARKKRQVPIEKGETSDQMSEVPSSRMQHSASSVAEIVDSAGTDTEGEEEEIVPLSLRLRQRTDKEFRREAKRSDSNYRTSLGDKEKRTSTQLSTVNSRQLHGITKAKSLEHSSESEISRGTAAVKANLSSLEMEKIAGHRSTAQDKTNAEEPPLLSTLPSNDLSASDDVGNSCITEQTVKQKTKKPSVADVDMKKTGVTDDTQKPKPVMKKKKIKKKKQANVERLHSMFRDESSLDLFDVTVPSPASMRRFAIPPESLQSTPVQNSCLKSVESPSVARYIGRFSSPLPNSPLIPLYSADKKAGPLNTSQLGNFSIELSLLNNLSCLSNVSISGGRPKDLVKLTPGTASPQKADGLRVSHKPGVFSNILEQINEQSVGLDAEAMTKIDRDELNSRQSTVATFEEELSQQNSSSGNVKAQDFEHSWSIGENSSQAKSVVDCRNLDTMTTESPVSLAERLKLRLTLASKSKALAGLQTMSQSRSSSEFKFDNKPQDFDSSDVVFLD